MDQEFTVQKDTGYVPQAQKDTPEGVLQEIERQAQAQVVSAKVEGAKAEDAKKASSSTNNGAAEGKLYGDIISDAIGLKTLSSAVEIIGTRLSDRSQIHHSKEATTLSAAPSASARHIDDDIFSATRKPGVYRSSVDVREVGVKPASGGADLSNLSITERVGLASASLQGEKGTGNLKSWVQSAFEAARVPSVPQQVKTMELQNGAKLAQDVTFSKENASDLALTSVKVAREHQSAMRGPQGPGMGMGMMGMNFDLSQGPRFNHAQYLGTEDKSGAA